MGHNGIVTETRERIRVAAEELYVLRGHDGFSFGDIAAATGTTRANIHHHFGNKRRLMAELVAAFACSASSRIARIWARPGHSFASRMEAQRQDLQGFYDRFNPKPGDRNVWSPISRVRLDLPVLGDVARDALESVNRAYDASLRQGLAEAVGSGELQEGMPVEEIAGMLRVTFLSCGPVTQDTGSFTDIEAMLRILARAVTLAWGKVSG